VKIKYFFILILLSLICYSNSLKGEFVWDDSFLIVNNPLIKDFKNLAKIFSAEILPSTGYYRPLQITSYLLDYHLYHLNPAGYHLTNILLHLFNSVLVLIILYHCSKNIFISFSTSLFFLTAPFHTEAVTFISARADLLLAFFLLFSFYFYIKEKYFFSLLFFSGALFSKEVALIFPFLLIFYDLCFQKGLIKKKRIYLFFFLEAVIYLTIHIFIFPNSYSAISLRFLPSLNLFWRLLAFFKSLFIYLGIILFPVDLHMERRLIFKKDFFLFLPYIIFFLILAGIFYLIFRYTKRKRLLLFALGWFFIFLLPQSSFFLPYLIAEHFLYLPSIGFFLSISILLEKIRQRKGKIVSFFIFIWVSYYSFLTFTANINWQNSITFYRWTKKYSPYSLRIHYLLGIHYIEKGLYNKGLEEFVKAAQIYEGVSILKEIDKFYRKDKKFLAVLHYNIGFILSQKGLFKKAEKEYKKALEFNPLLLEAYNGLGCLYIKERRLKEAEEVFKKLLKIEPSFSKAYYNLGIVYLLKDEKEKTYKVWRKALEFDPDYGLVKESLRKIDVKK